MKQIGNVLLTTFRKWQNHNAARLAAALSYYTLFALAPLLIVAVGAAGLILGTSVARAQLTTQVQSYMGPGMAAMMLGLIDTATLPGSGLIATIIGVATLITGSSGLFGELQADLNIVWEVPVRAPQGIIPTMIDLVRNRMVAFLMVLGVGVLLILSGIVSTLLTGFGDLLGAGGTQPATTVIQAISFAISLCITALAFAVVFRVLPDTKVHWSDVWIGAIVTSLLFNAGVLLIGLYLGISRATTAYGAAGSLVALLLWINYSAQIFLLGAEFTHVVSEHRNESRRRRKAEVKTVNPPG